MTGAAGPPGTEEERRGHPYCAWHPQQPATALCVSCSRPVCPQCDRLWERRHYCFDCAYRLQQERMVYVVQPPPSPKPPEPQDEREKRWWRADWGLGEAFLALAVIFVPYNILGVLLLLLRKDLLFINYIAYAAFFCPLAAAATFYVARRHHRGPEELGLRWAERGRTLVAGALGSLAALALSYGAVGLIMLLFYIIAGRVPSSGAEEVRGMGGGAVALMLVSVVVLAPVFEELYFRGLLYPALRRRMGPRMAIFINGLVFGALHFEPLFLISLVLVGVVLAYEYEKTDSLFAPMLTHAAYNLAVTLITLFAGW